MFNWLLYGNIWIAIGAVGITTGSYVMLNKTIEIEILLMVFFATFSGYNYQRMFFLLVFLYCFLYI